MRFQTLVLLATLSLTSSRAGFGAPPSSSYVLFGALHFQTMRGELCDLTVRGTSEIRDKRLLSVSCAGTVLFNQRTSDFFVDVQTSLSEHQQRFFIRWEGGQARLQVLELAEDSANRDTIVERFNTSSEFMPEVLLSPDVVLVHRDKKITDQGIILPSRTDIFSWTEGKYVLTGSWKWTTEAQFEDRFCMLQSVRTACPMVPIPAGSPGPNDRSKPR